MNETKPKVYQIANDCRLIDFGLQRIIELKQEPDSLGNERWNKHLEWIADDGSCALLDTVLLMSFAEYIIKHRP